MRRRLPSLESATPTFRARIGAFGTRHSSLSPIASTSLVIDGLRGAIVGPVSLDVARGGCAAITGPSGAGKSLFLRMIADLDPCEGEVRLGDLDRRAIPAPAWRRRVIHVAAEPGWWADTVAAHFSETSRPAAGEMAARLALPPDVLGRAVVLLSTGERQRLALVRALARRPDTLLLDEPTSALDPASIEMVEALLREAMAGGTILVVVSHDPAQAGRLGAARYAMTAGRLAPA